MHDLQRADPRVRFFDHPKGPRNGEIYRHAALRDARGSIVCYLSDDDLWLPHHVETMEALLRKGNFGHTLSVVIAPDGQLLAGNRLDFRNADSRRAYVAGELGGFGLSCMAHTIELYRALPVGWDTTPVGTPTDVFMGRKLVAHPDCRPVSGTRPTLLRFPNHPRRDWPAERREAELEHWSMCAADPAWMAELPFAVLDSVVQGDAGRRFKLAVLRRRSSRGDAPVITLEWERLRATIAAKTAECQGLRVAEARLQLLAEDATRARKQIVGELSRRAAERGELLAERDLLTAGVQELETSNGRLMADLQELENSNRRLAIKLSRSRRECDALANERDRLRTERDAIRAAHHAVKAELSELQRSIAVRIARRLGYHKR